MLGKSRLRRDLPYLPCFRDGAGGQEGERERCAGLTARFKHGRMIVRRDALPWLPWCTPVVLLARRERDEGGTRQRAATGPDRLYLLYSCRAAEP